MIEMGADYDVLIRQSGQIADHVVHGFDHALDIHVGAHFERIRQRKRMRLEIAVDGRGFFVQILAGRFDPARRDFEADLHEGNAGVVRPDGLAKFFHVVGIAAMIGLVVDENDAARAVQFGIDGFAEKLRVFSIDAAVEHAFFVVLLRLVAQNQHQLVADV